MAKNNLNGLPRVTRGEIWWVDLNVDGIGSEQAGKRPCLVIQNDVGNRFSPTTIVALITAKNKTAIPTHMEIPLKDIPLRDMSTIMFEQLRTVDKKRFLEKVRNLSHEEMNTAKEKINISLGLA